MTKDKPGSAGADPKAARRGVAEALRSAYQETVDEKVPQDFLDLLGKLG